MAGLDRQQWGFANWLRHLGKTDEEIESGKPSETTRRVGTDPNAPATPVDRSDTEQEASPAADAATNAIAKLPFETYIPAEDGLDTKEYFDFESGPLSSDPPQGSAEPPELACLGVLQVEEEPAKDRPGLDAGAGGRGFAPARGGGFQSKLQVYLDPLTMEPISQTYKKDADGNVLRDASNVELRQDNDSWFRVKLKIEVPSLAKDGQEKSTGSKRKSFGVGSKKSAW